MTYGWSKYIKELQEEVASFKKCAFQAQEMAKEIAERLQKSQAREKVLVEALEYYSKRRKPTGQFGESCMGTPTFHPDDDTYTAREALKRVGEMK